MKQNKIDKSIFYKTAFWTREDISDVLNVTVASVSGVIRKMDFVPAQTFQLFKYNKVEKFSSEEAFNIADYYLKYGGGEKSKPKINNDAFSKNWYKDRVNSMAFDSFDIAVLKEYTKDTGIKLDCSINYMTD